MHDGTTRTDGDWSAPALRGLRPSQRSRTWSRKTRGSGRVLMPMPWDVDFDTELHGESGLEGKAVYALVAHPKVRRIWEQPPAVTYVDERGRRRSHTVDLLALMEDGTKTACLVKPKVKADRANLNDLRRRLAAQVPRRFADRWVLLNEGKLRRNVVRNGMTIMRVKLDGPWSEDPAVALAASIATEPTRVADLIVACAGGADFWAVVRLVADGRLRVRDNALLDVDAVVEPIFHARP